LKPHLWFIKFVGVLVPRRLRPDWRQEWEAELRYREELLLEWDNLNRRGKLALLWHGLGAFADALWLQPRRWEDEMFQDLRYGVRALLKRPGFSLVVVFILALGIGATSSIFSVVNAVLLRPLPYPEPERLMMFFSARQQEGQSERNGSVYGPDFVEWRGQCRSCAQMGAYTGTWPGNLTGGAEPDRVRIARVTEGLFSTLGVQPVLGRTFSPEDAGRPLFSNDSGSTRSTAVILSYGLWRRRFGADPTVIGKSVRVEGDACAVIGVMPEGFKFPDEADAWLPATLGPKRDNAFLRVIGRLQSGATLTQAQAELGAIAGRLAQEFPQTNRGLGVNLVPLQEYVIGDARSSLLIFLGAVGFVLLIACANVANLSLARAATRRKEMALRAALGASRLRVIRQLLTESLLLAMMGGGLGLLLAFGVLKVLVASAPNEIPRLNAIRIDLWALGFTLSVSALTGVIFGLAPALQASRPDLIVSLKEGGTRAVGAARHRLRSLLVVAEISMALVLLIGAGLLLKSFMRLRETSLGFNPDHVVVGSVTLPEGAYPGAAQVKRFYQQALSRLAARPEAQAVGVVSSLPLGDTGAGVRGDLTVEGEPTARPKVSAYKLAVSADYFRALGVPLLKGRAFDARDTGDSPGVLIISDALARDLWPDEDALGKRINIGFRGETWREIVGIVGNLKQRDLGAPPVMALYQPFSQVADSRRWMLEEMTFVARTAQPQNFVAAMRGELQTIDKDLPLHNVAQMNGVVAKNIADPRFYTLLLGSFSALALILAAAGIYSLMSYSVTQRTHEIGIRMALGAKTSAILRLVVRQGMTLALAGLAVGLGGAFALTRVLSKFLYQVSVTDPLSFALLSLLLAAVALAACYLPARRATKVDPMAALRQD
jgi:putative ABC transport system permease protein